MKQALSQASVETLEKRQRALALVNLSFFWALPLLVLVGAVDFIRWGVELHRSVQPLSPNLSEIEKSLPSIPSFTLPATIFPEPVKPKAPEKPAQTQPQLAVKEVQWKLKGVVMGENKRAFLEDAEGKQGIWVTEGEVLGSSRVKEIHEHSVILENEDKSYEIRM